MQQGRLKVVELLSLDNNQLTHLPEWLGGLTALRELSVKNNQLTHLPKFFGKLTVLTALELRGNPLSIDSFQFLIDLKLYSDVSVLCFDA